MVLPGSGVGAPINDGTVYGDANPTHDACSHGTTVAMSGQNIGNLLNAQGITWGWFEGGFAPTSTSPAVVCGSAHTNVGGVSVTDYIPHHEPFQYYQSTSNPNHLPPTSEAMVGLTDQANHQYDLSWFYASLQDGNMPAVSFLKAPAYQDGHAGYSDPLDEQTFLVNTINMIQSSQYWKNTAIIITYDDSDGWYDHVMGPIVMQSNTPQDALTGTGSCGVAATGVYEDRCGYGPRLPLLVISPYARFNYVFNGLTDQSSITRFIEDNWNLGRIGDQSFDAIAGSLNGAFNFNSFFRLPPLFLNPSTGLPEYGFHGPAAIVYDGVTYTA